MFMGEGLKMNIFLSFQILLLLVLSALIFGYGVFWFLGPRIGRRLPKSWIGIGLVLLTVLTVAVYWGTVFVRNRNYTVLVTVLSPDGRPIPNARVFTSVAGEVLPTSFGSTIRLRGGTLPADGKIEVYADSNGMSAVSSIQVGNRQNESVTLKLSNDAFVVTGIVIDVSANPIRGAEVQSNYTPGFIEVTDDTGRFRLTLKDAKLGDRIILSVDKNGYLSSRSYYVVSESPLTVVLRRQTLLGQDKNR
jgi:hypothetical protein